MKQFEKLKTHNNDNNNNNILVRKTKEYSQIVLPCSLRNIVYNERHSKMGHLGTDKVFELARKGFYWPKMYLDIELYIT